jgi:hypothetical protein
LLRKLKPLWWVAICFAALHLHSSKLPEQFFGMNVLHAINRTPWPTAKIASIRLWDTDDTSWSHIEPARGKFDWDGLDRWLTLAGRHKVEVVYTFGRVPKWANGNKHQSVPPIDLEDWDAFVRAIVRHAKGRIVAWELWNEPNDPSFWTGDLNTLLQMSQRAYRIIKAEQPSAIVLTPSATWHENVSPSQWFRQYFSAGGGSFADVIAFHGYVGTAPEGLTREVENIRKAAADSSIEKPLWDTESSWGIDAKLNDPASQAAFLARSYILHASQGVHRFYWYAWDGSDGGATSDQSWGTLWEHIDGVREPGRVLTTVANWLRDAELPLICQTSKTVWTCILNNESTIVWDSASDHPYSVDSRFTRYHDLAGHVHPVAANKIVPIGPSPILLNSHEDKKP